MILFIGFELAKSSLEKVLHPVTVEFSLLSMIVLIASILVKAEMMIFNTRMGKGLIPRLCWLPRRTAEMMY